MGEIRELALEIEERDSEDSIDNKIVQLLDKVRELEKSGEKRKVEVLLLDELKKATEAFERWSIMIALVEYYNENRMYLKMDKIAKNLIQEFPDNYAGYHSKYMVEVARKHYAEALKYLGMIPEDFKTHHIYYKDCIELYERMNDFEGMLNFIDGDENIIHTIPEYTLQKKILALSKLERYAEASPWLLALVRVFDNMDAKVTLMLLLYFNQDFGRSALVARDIMEDDKGVKSYRSFLAYIIQVYNVLMLSDGKPDEKMKDSLNSALVWIKEYVRQHENEIPDGEELIESIEQDINHDK